MGGVHTLAGPEETKIKASEAHTGNRTHGMRARGYARPHLGGRCPPPPRTKIVRPALIGESARVSCPRLRFYESDVPVLYVY